MLPDQRCHVPETCEGRSGIQRSQRASLGAGGLGGECEGDVCEGGATYHHDGGGEANTRHFLKYCVLGAQANTSVLAEREGAKAKRGTPPGRLWRAARHPDKSQATRRHWANPAQCQ